MATTQTSELETTATLARSEQTKHFREQIETCKLYRRHLIGDWQVNVDYRRGKPFASQSDTDRVVVNLDWSLTKEKQDALFSQVPAVRVSHPPQSVADDSLPWLHTYEQRINDIGLQAGIEAALDQVLPDCINAAGIGVVAVAREAITESVEVPAIDIKTFPPQLQLHILQTNTLPDGSPIPMETVPRVTDSRYTVSRISPADFLWPLGFTGSDFDQAPWVGRSGRISWAEAVQRFGLTEEDKKGAVGEAKTNTDRIDRLASDTEYTSDLYDEMVSFDEIFYKDFHYNPSAKSFGLIRRLVFVTSKPKPVVDDVWEGQQIDQDSGQVIGALKYPIRVLTLTYLTDDAIPPSDTAIGRPQVDEINKSRSQMIQQREHSLPVRWFDVNRVDPAIQYTLMRGTWQGMIPVQGNGDNIIGEVARSSMPSENFVFDRIAKEDLARVWQTGASQFAQQIETKAEVESVEAVTGNRVARERAKVGKFFIGIMEVLGGLISIYEDPNSFGEGFTPLISRTLSYSILADSTILLDSNQRLKKIIQFINFAAKSGWVDVGSVLKEAATLSGLDPAVVIRPPQPKPPVEPNVSLRLTGTEDLMNPLVLGFLMKSGQAPDPKLIEAAKKLIEIAVTPPVPPPMGMSPDGMGPDSLPLPGELNLEIPAPPTPEVGAAEPQWSALDRINKRVVER